MTQETLMHPKAWIEAWDGECDHGLDQGVCVLCNGASYDWGLRGFTKSELERYQRERKSPLVAAADPGYVGCADHEPGGCPAACEDREARRTRIELFFDEPQSWDLERRDRFALGEPAGGNPAPNDEEYIGLQPPRRKPRWIRNMWQRVTVCDPTETHDRRTFLGEYGLAGPLKWELLAYLEVDDTDASMTPEALSTQLGDDALWHQEACPSQYERPVTFQRPTLRGGDDSWMHYELCSACSEPERYDDHTCCPSCGPLLRDLHS